MTGSVETRKAELASLAAQLRRAVDGMDAAVGSPPDAPNAGESTGSVAEVLGLLTRSAAALTETASKAAADLDVCRRTYDDIDQAGADVFTDIR